MRTAQLTTNLSWGEIEKRMRDNFRLWDNIEWMRPPKPGRHDDSTVTIEVLIGGDWRVIPCSKFRRAEQNYHALLLAFEAVRKADQRGIAGIFGEVARHFALPEGQSGPHAVLNVNPGASRDDIRTAYRAALIDAHPDHGGSRQQLDKVRDAGRALGVAG